MSFEIVGTIKGRAYPWKMAPINRYGQVNKEAPQYPDYRHYKDWKEIVHFEALAIRMEAKEKVFGGPVAMEVAFHMRPRPGKMDPDLSNLVKAFEDGLQGSLIENDRQVANIQSSRVIADGIEERVEFRLRAIVRGGVVVADILPISEHIACQSS